MPNPVPQPRLVPALLVFFLFAATGAAAETRAGGEIQGAVEWTKQDSPYILVKDVVVPKGSTLTIREGVTVRCKPDITDDSGFNKFDVEFLVEGSLIVQGAAGDTVVFTSDSPTPRWTDWQGIVVQNGGRADIHAARIEFCNEGVRVFGGSVELTSSSIAGCYQYGARFTQGTGVLDDMAITSVGNAGGTGVGVYMERGSDVAIRNSFIVGVQNGVMWVRDAGGSMENTVVSNCTGVGVTARNSSPTVTECTVTANDIGLSVSAGAAPTVRNNNIFVNARSDLEISGYKELTRLDFGGNWWGDDTVLGHVDGRVFDAMDDPEAGGVAILEPILPEAYMRPSAADPKAGQKP